MYPILLRHVLGIPINDNGNDGTMIVNETNLSLINERWEVREHRLAPVGQATLSQEWLGG